MKTLILLIVFLAGSSLCFAQSGLSCFSSPIAGDIIISGQSVPLHWFTNSEVSGQVRLSMWNQGDGNWMDIGIADYKSGAFIWTAPQIYGKSFRLRGIESDGSVIYSNGFFSIQPPAPKTETKPTSMVTVPMLTVHPNPAVNLTRICVPDLAAGTAVKMIVVNSVGEIVSTLYDATPDAELGLCCTLDCSKLPDGVYFARLWNDVLGQSVKLVVNH